MERARVRYPAFGSDTTNGLGALGAVAVGAAVFEVALVPAVLLGGAAVLAPDLISKHTLTRVSRKLRRWTGFGGAGKPAATRALETVSFNIWRAAAKTVTYRIALTTVDF